MCKHFMVFGEFFFRHFDNLDRDKTLEKFVGKNLYYSMEQRAFFLPFKNIFGKYFFFFRIQQDPFIKVVNIILCMS